MAASYPVIGVHPNSVADGVIADAGFLPAPTVDALATALNRVLAGERPPTDPVERARQYDWNAVAEQAERAYQAAIDDT